MKNYWPRSPLFFLKWLGIACLFFACASSFAQTGASSGEPLLLARNKKSAKAPVVVKSIRHSRKADKTRVVIDLSRSAAYTISRHPASQQVRIQLAKAVIGKPLKHRRNFSVKGSLIRRIEARQDGKNRVDIALTYSGLGMHKPLVLKHPDRLVLDFYPPERAAPPFEIQTIVVDPGHGGKDPGAMSKSGLTEKEVVLDVSRRLKKLIEKRLKKKVILTRNRDVFISLKKRTRIANENRADLFISVHVNSSPRRNTKGIEVYLMGRASNRRALAVARRENAAMHDGLRNFQEMILDDLEREFTKNASLELAHFTNDAIKKNLISKYPTPALGVKKAPFFVLAHTEMPAILAELSFLSNRVEEKRLRSKSYRQRAAEALFKGIKNYIDSLNAGL